jgi:predicted nucleic acid-binding protein
MADAAAVDASPVIVLARAGWLDLLRVVADRIVIPSEVAVEIRRRGSDDPAAAALTALRWLDVIDVGRVDPRVQDCRLDPGESAVLTWALVNRGNDAIVDDKPARRCARVLRVPFLGTLGVILAAKHRGVIAAARPVVEDVGRAGLYLAEHTVAEALAGVGE